MHDTSPSVRQVCRKTRQNQKPRPRCRLIILKSPAGTAAEAKMQGY